MAKKTLKVNAKAHAREMGLRVLADKYRFGQVGSCPRHGPLNADPATVELVDAFYRDYEARTGEPPWPSRAECPICRQLPEQELMLDALRIASAATRGKASSLAKAHNARRGERLAKERAARVEVERLAKLMNENGYEYGSARKIWEALRDSDVEISCRSVESIVRRARSRR